MVRYARHDGKSLLIVIARHGARPVREKLRHGVRPVMVSEANQLFWFYHRRQI